MEALGHIPGCHVWHMCIDEIHVEDVIAVSREALEVTLCATCCRTPCRWLTVIMWKLWHSG